jgi:uncharacterized protein YbbC (DUF1343 family)
MNYIKRQLFISIIIFFYGINLSAQIVTGAEQIERYLPLLQDKSVAVCCNQTSVIAATHLVDSLTCRGVYIAKIFAPEHGFRGEAEAGATIHSSTDPKTGIPIVSLYGNNKKPTPMQLNDVDIIVFDIQDVGCRFFTYISTLHYIMEAAAAQDIPVMIFDRPNPNGYFVDGPVLEAKHKSFVGMHPVPVVYGMTIGEYAQMINGEKWLENNLMCDLSVIECENYTHQTKYSLSIKPSPNLGTDEAVYLYPSLCFFEGTDISVGRGANKPFQIFGHPNLPFGDFYFTPQPIAGISENPPQKGKKCRGVDLTNEAVGGLQKSNSCNIAYLLAAYKNFPKEMKFFTNPDFFDKLAGTSTFRMQILGGATEAEIRASWQPALQHFKTIRNKYLIYPE